MSEPVASKTRRPSRPSMPTRAESLGLVESGRREHRFELEVGEPERG